MPVIHSRHQHRILATLSAAFAAAAMMLCTSAGAQEWRTEPVSAEPEPGALSLAGRAVSSAQELVMQAMGMIGIRYTFGGKSPDTGFDCSGLVRYVFDRVTGRLLPPTSYELSAVGVQVNAAELQPGDLVFFNTRGRKFSHVGIYVGEGRFIHAPSRGGSVHIVSMRAPYWLARFDGARRVAG
jgi:cell wall-associated NlpC family hydrolase